MANQNFEDIIKIERTDGVLHRSFLCRPLGEADGDGNVFGVEMLKDGVPSDLTGCSCTAYFIRPDGITLILRGTVSENRATVSLPQACYAKEGNYSLAIKIAGSGYSETVRIVDGTVVGTTTGDVADPESTLPSLAELLAVIGDAEAAAESIAGLISDIDDAAEEIQSAAEDIQEAADEIEAAAVIINRIQVNAVMISGTRYRLEVTT